LPLIFRGLMAYVRYVGGGLAGERFEQQYLAEIIPPGSIVMDAGGGESKLANRLSATARLVVVLDREATCLQGADNTLYQGSLHKLLKTRKSARVIPLMGDATCTPLAAGSVDAIVSSQVLEHLPPSAKRAFFAECARSLRPGGLLVVSTPSEEFYAADPLWVSKVARKLLPKKLISRLPNLLRGPWMEQSLEEWETKAGHYGHGCRLDDLVATAERCGLQTIHHRYTYTRLSFFWFELLATCPLLGFLSAPLATLSMAIEARLPVRLGANLMIRFRNVTRPT
jgi:SAM-dependent methyltransferase